MRPERIESLENALDFLRSVGTETNRVERGWILREVDDNGAYVDRMCDSDADLVAIARAMREQAGVEPGKRGHPRPEQALRPGSPPRRSRQTVLLDWADASLPQQQQEGEHAREH